MKSNEMIGIASLPASVGNLVKTIIGAGILSVPWAFGQTGHLLGAVLLFVVALVQAFALHLLALLVLDSRGRGEDASFRSLANAAFGGSKAVGTMVELIVLSFCFGVATSHLFIIGDLLPQVCEYAGAAGEFWFDRRLWITAVGFLVELPLMCLPSLDSLKVSSIIGNIAVVYIVVVVSLFATGVLASATPAQEASVLPPHQTQFTSTTGMIQSIPIFITGFSCAPNIPSLVLELRDASIHRVNMMIGAAVCICFFMFLVVGTCGTSAFGASVHGDLLRSFPHVPGTMGGLAASAARIATVLNVVGCFPLYMHPARASLSQLLFRKKPQELSLLAWATLTAGLLLSSWLLAMEVNTLESAVSFNGATAGMLVGFSFPALFYCRLGTDHADDAYKLMVDARTPGQGVLKTKVWMMALVSIALIPLLICVQVFHVSRVG